jgi:hypothetical protein
MAEVSVLSGTKSCLYIKKRLPEVAAIIGGITTMTTLNWRGGRRDLNEGHSITMY